MYKIENGLTVLTKIDALRCSLPCTNLPYTKALLPRLLIASFRGLISFSGKSLGDLLICCRQTVDSCLALYFTTGRLPTRCYSENVLDLLHSLPGM